jgi:hypothetical protein
LGTETLNSLFRKLILLNELSGNLNAALRLSLCSGGKSGYSFGESQLDINNNPAAVACLLECGFSITEVSGLQAKILNPSNFTARLQAHADIIAKYDEAQLSECLDRALNFDSDYGIPVANTAAILAGADYCNQYGSEGNGAKAYYKALGRPITAEDVLQFKLTQTKYGKENPGDCRRRYANIAKVLTA